MSDPHMDTDQAIDADQIETSVRLLRMYLDKTPETEALLSALEALQQEPQNGSYLNQFTRAFKQYEMQGAVLTYAPYLMNLLSEDPFDNH
ncbi:hypothetical protein [Candidatus Thiothrix anitrata]|uniref:Uncharacterized protein n=1 Tax=Candidatus Thiothrix anitrata TaxID=2823902 RepID=A0ABX7X3J2_9GAMM|nr:hypothetical protein [Candidatus Thiothrix anitrata]QTR49173.1 hypothetical protein J8380_12990 [Candidatus Thiothrix anitrata]